MVIRNVTLVFVALAVGSWLPPARAKRTFSSSALDTPVSSQVEVNEANSLPQGVGDQSPLKKAKVNASTSMKVSAHLDGSSPPYKQIKASNSSSSMAAMRARSTSLLNDVQVSDSTMSNSSLEDSLMGKKPSQNCKRKDMEQAQGDTFWNCRVPCQCKKRGHSEVFKTWALPFWARSAEENGTCDVQDLNGESRWGWQPEGGPSSLPPGGPGFPKWTLVKGSPFLKSETPSDLSGFQVQKNDACLSTHCQELKQACKQMAGESQTCWAVTTDGWMFLRPSMEEIYEEDQEGQKVTKTIRSTPSRITSDLTIRGASRKRRHDPTLQSHTHRKPNGERTMHTLTVQQCHNHEDWDTCDMKVQTWLFTDGMSIGKEDHPDQCGSRSVAEAYCQTLDTLLEERTGDSKKMHVFPAYLNAPGCDVPGCEHALKYHIDLHPEPLECEPVKLRESSDVKNFIG